MLCFLTILKENLAMETYCFQQISPTCYSNSLSRYPHYARIKHNQKDIDFSRRRAILFVGISVLPLLQLRVRAFEELSADVSELRAKNQKQEAKGTDQVHELQNPLLSLLNGVGFLGSGVLAVFYGLDWKEKTSTDAATESVRAKLKEKEEAIVSMGRKFELELNAKEHLNKQVKKASEEHQTLLNRLTSANTTIASLGEELQKEKKVVQEFKDEIYCLQNNLMKSGEDKNTLQEELNQKLESIEVIEEKRHFLGQEIRDKEESLQRASNKLAEKEAEFNKLSLLTQQSQCEIFDLTSEIEEHKGVILRKERELELKNAGVYNLEAHVTSLLVERNELNKKLETIHDNYNNLKSTSENKAMSDAKLLDEQQQMLQQLQKKLDVSLDDISRNELLEADFTQENDELKKALHKELENVNNLKCELQITLETLNNSRNEASDLKNQLHQSRKLCFDLKAKVSKVRSEFDERRESLERNMEEAKQYAKRLAAELTTHKELIKKTSEEMQIMSCELTSVYETRNSLQKELVDVYRKAEDAANDLKEEKSIHASLNKELKILETQFIKDKEVRKSLETDLEKVTKSLDETNQIAFALSKDLELANTRISSLEDEREVLYKSMVEQKRVFQEAQENMEDAHILVMRLGKEKEKLEKRANKLEEDIAASKGKILRLKTQINSSKKLLNEPPQQKVDSDSEENAMVSAKRQQTKRKAVPQLHDDDDDDDELV